MMRTTKLFFLLNAGICLAIFFLGCTDKSNVVEDQIEDGLKGLFEIIPPTESGVDFVNVYNDTLMYNIFAYEYSYNGSGVAVGDINNDGLPDLYFGSSLGNNKLYLNLGNFKFKDITATANVSGGGGIKTGVSMVDINDDGLLDIYVCKAGNITDLEPRRNRLYINNGDLTFTERSAEYGLDDPSYSTQAHFGDIDGDGDLDLYLINHPINWTKQNKMNLNYDEQGEMYVVRDTTRMHISDRLYINEGGKFVDRTKKYGVDNIAFGLGAIIADFNDDGKMDIYVSNDYVEPDYLYINKGDRFEDEADKYFKNMSTTSMGVDIFDANNDGKFDLFVNDMMPEHIERIKQNRSFVNYDGHLIGRKFDYKDQFRYNSFQIKNDLGKFSNIAYLTGTSATDWSWAPLGEDYDFNGHTDLFITNGFLKELNGMDYSMFQLDSIKKSTPLERFPMEWKKLVREIKEKNYWYSNQGDLKFVNVSNHWDPSPSGFSNGAAYADLDNDGTLDMIINNINAPASILKNTLKSKKKVKSKTVQLKQSGKNLFAIGAKVAVQKSDGTEHWKYLHPARGYMSSTDYRLTFGCAENIKMQTFVVHWPDGTQEQYGVDNTEKTQVLVKGQGSKITPKAPPTALLDRMQLPWQHVENEYIDFKREPLLHTKNSAEGPAVAVGDFDGDGLEDIYFGGAKSQPSEVLFQQANGIWNKKPQPDFIRDMSYEDVAAAPVDIDSDGDIDLVAVSGGYEADPQSEAYLLRCYLNDGKGVFTRDTNFPDIRLNGASILTTDINNDGRIDLVIGGGAKLNFYPNCEGTRILINSAAGFIDESSKWFEDNRIGIVKDIKEVRLNGKKHLLAALEFGPMKLYRVEKSKLVEVTEDFGLGKSHGFWQSLYPIIDQSGDLTAFVAGNLGKNTFFKITEDKPLCIYSNDFDENGEHDAILCAYFGEKSYSSSLGIDCSIK